MDRSYLSRRSLLSAALASVFPLLSLSCADNRQSGSADYSSMLASLIGDIADSEQYSIRDSANMFADTIIARKRCFFFSSHPALTAFFDDTENGLPPLFILLRSTAMAEAVGNGDTLLTTDTGAIPELCHRNGAQIAGISSALSADGSSDPEREGLAHKNNFTEICDTLIQSHLPVTDSLLHSDDYPHSIFSAFTPVVLAIIAAVSGEAYARSGGIGLSDSSAPSVALSYLEIVRSRVEALSASKTKLANAAALATQSRTEGKRVIVSSQNAFTGADLRSSFGMQRILEYLTPQVIRSGSLSPGDCLIYCASSSNDPGDMIVIGAAKKWTDRIITISPQHSSGGYRLDKEASVALGNQSPETDGIITFDSGTKHFLRTHHIINAVILRALVSSVTAV